jgi:hypothetical protein
MKQNRLLSVPFQSSKTRYSPYSSSLWLVLASGLLVLGQTACTPSVQVAMPSEPININLNVKIQHEILIKVDKQLDAMFSESSGLF